MENKNIALKIVKVMEGIESVSKDGFNAFHKYKYVTDAAIVTEIRKSMIANKLIVIPKQTSCIQTGDLTTLQVEYMLIDADSGESITTQVFGYGKDTGDKGLYKASTGAEKYFLLKTFLLPTDDDPENETKQQAEQSIEGYNTNVRVPANYWKYKDAGDMDAANELIGKGFYPKKTPTGWFIFSKEKVVENLPAPKVLQGAPEPLKKAPEPPQSAETFISQDQRVELHKIAKERGVHHLTFKKYLKDTFGIEETAKIKASSYLEVFTWLDSFSPANVGQ